MLRTFERFGVRVTISTWRGRALKAARELATEEGAFWLRDVIKRYGVAKLSDLSDGQLEVVLATAE